MQEITKISQGKLQQTPSLCFNNSINPIYLTKLKPGIIPFSVMRSCGDIDHWKFTMAQNMGLLSLLSLFGDTGMHYTSQFVFG